MPDVGYDDHQRAYAEVVTAFCAQHTATWSDPRPEFDPSLWAGLGDLGVLGLTAADSGAEPLDVVAAHEALGFGGCPGPLWATALVVGAGSGPAVASGQLLATVGSPDRMPWAAQADLIFELADGILWRCEGVTVVDETVSLGFEPVARIVVSRRDRVEATPRAVALAELALAAYLAGAGRRILADVVGYVQVRRQFRRTLSEFQAVAHPLADCDARLSAAAGLVRRGAARLDSDPVAESGVALASAARAARLTLYQAHQAYGGIGFAQEGPLAWIGARVGQLSTEAQAMWRARPLSSLISDR